MSDALPVTVIFAAVAAVGVAAVILGVRPLRRQVLTRPILAVMNRLDLLPTISATEREALEAGTVWIDRELFSGAPDWRRILGEPYPELSESDRAVLDGPVARACAGHSDWQAVRDFDLAPETWDLLRDERLFSLVIPEAHGGRGMSARGHGAVITKLATRSLPLAVTVMVPNSLGPGELLVHHGTDEQQRRWLPGLASGREVPCFALTEAGAGSDASAMESRGVVFRGADGELAIRLTWRKRYITLSAVASVIGLAFRLEDPDELLGLGKEPGITCALVPAELPGVTADRRHDPLGVPFVNGPTSGEDVVVPIDAIIGGVGEAGRGWRMLMETLAAGRGVSLPSMSCGIGKLCLAVASAHAGVRRQFGMRIARFEGIEEPLARLAGRTYLLEAAQVFTCGAIDAGERPAVVSAIVKHRATELARECVADAMDVTAGNGIIRGPKNLLAMAHAAAPIGITVEGANILTRTLIIFGQGAIRCHPHARAELEAAAAGDLAAFDRAFFAHVAHVARNAVRGVLHALTRGRLARVPRVGAATPLLRRMTWASCWTALHADLAMALLGGELKRREALTGRFADALSWLYFASAAVRRFEADGRPVEDEPVMRWSVEHALAEVQRARVGILENFPVRGVGLVLRWLSAPWARLNPFGTGPSDALRAEVARLLRRPTATRKRLLAGTYWPADDEPLARLEDAFRLCSEAEPLLRRIRRASRAGTLPRAASWTLVEAAREAGVLDAAEADVVERAERARREVIEVDAFPASLRSSPSSAGDR